QPIRTAQFQRHKNCAKLRADSGRSVGRMIEQHRRLQVEWFCNSSLASDLVAIHSPWNLRRFAPRNDGVTRPSVPLPRRHCERSEAIHALAKKERMDCFVAALLAMTR